MSNRERILVVLLTLSVCLHVILVVAWWITVPAPMPIAAAPGEKEQAAEKPVWHTKWMAIPNTQYTAFAGPWVYESEPGRSPARYSISVEEPTPNGHRPLYHVSVAVEDLPPGFLNKAIEDIVVYDQKERFVSFMIGDRVYGFRLPDRPQ